MLADTSPKSATFHVFTEIGELIDTGHVLTIIDPGVKKKRGGREGRGGGGNKTRN